MHPKEQHVLLDLGGILNSSVVKMKHLLIIILIIISQLGMYHR